jgi:predicted ATPase
MLIQLDVRNFKRFREVRVELGSPVVFVGPNDSGKTTALQALALWHLGVRRWNEKRGSRAAPEKRPGVTINRRDLIASPVPDASMLWRDLHVRDVRRVEGGQQTRNVRVDIAVTGVTDGKQWTCGLEFDYANEESFYCRPLRLSDAADSARMPVPEQAAEVRIAFLPPMSGLASNETRLDPGAVQVRLGEGRTAEVLRNICHQVAQENPGAWNDIVETTQRLFGARVEKPFYIPERGEIEMRFRTRAGATRLDLSSSGRGFQQTLLLLTHLAANPGSVLLLDEPDAHLEILRQRQVYQILVETARRHDCQVIAASHSEVVLNEAADRDVVVAFLGKPHRIDDRGSQLLKSLKEIGYDQYYQAEQTGWVLYLEGSTDLAILRSLAQKSGHPAAAALEQPFVHYVFNQPPKARDHFHGLREAKKDLVGFALFDRLDRELQPSASLDEYAWTRRELENYLCSRDVLLAWAKDAAREMAGGGPLIELDWEKTMEAEIGKLENALRTLGKNSPWSPDIKATDEFLDPLFENFFLALGLPPLMRKTDYHQLARYVPPAEVDAEVKAVLDRIAAAKKKARPRTDDE